VGAESAAQQLAYRLPEAEIGQMEALLDLLVEAPFNGRADLPHLAEEAGVTDDDLLPACEALALLQLATIERGDIIVTPFGKTYMETEPPERKVLFGQKLLEQVALASHIRAELEANEDGEIREEQVLRELEAYLKPEEAERVLKIGIEWGRYGEVYEYVYNTGMLTLPREEREEREEREAQEGDGAAGA
jgi:NitT/TauT family transport system ATP-binding protein